MDVLFHGATVYDGSGAEGVRQDVAVRGENSITQGVTTELIGLCGFSVARLRRSHSSRRRPVS